MIGDDIREALPGLQAEAESLMTTPCRIRRPTGVTPDPVTGADVVTYEAGDVYASTACGRPGCRLKVAETQVATPESADSTVTVQRYELSIPVGAGPVRVGDVAELLGRRFRITGLHTQTHQTAQRLPVEEAS